MTEQELREAIFDQVNDQTCRVCDFWDWQGHYCFYKDMHQDPRKCRLVNRFLALVKEAGYKSPEEVRAKIEEAKKQDWERIINDLDKCFELAPNDDSYFRILVKDVRDELKTGKTRKERADENYERHQREEEKKWV